MRKILRAGFLCILCILCTLLFSHNLPAASYTVQKGETLYQIAKSQSTSVEALTKANPTINPQRLHPGDVLRLPSSPTSAPTPPAPAKTSPSPVAQTKTTPPTEWVRIKKGDSLAKIARENNLTITDLQRWNRLSGDSLRSGDLLRLRPPPSSTPTKITSTSSPSKTLPTPSLSPPKPATRELIFIEPARAQIDAPKDRLRDWEYIVVHHSGTSGGNAKIFDYFHRHTRGMENGMAYHFVIGNGSDSGDGQIEVGSRWLQQKQGGHLASEALNEIAIGICLVGDFSTHRLGPRQTASLIELVQYLRRLQPDSKLKFRLHREINTKPTECPGKLFPSTAIHEILD
jgi:LysM repeat protein